MRLIETLVDALNEKGFSARIYEKYEVRRVYIDNLDLSDKSAMFAAVYLFYPSENRMYHADNHYDGGDVMDGVRLHVWHPNEGVLVKTHKQVVNLLREAGFSTRSLNAIVPVWLAEV